MEALNSLGVLLGRPWS